MMADTPESIITDDEITRVHANANFGDMAPRAVVNETVLKFAVGYSTGHTAECIAREHGLIGRRQSQRRTPDLTAKGKRYLRAAIGERFEEVAEIVAPPSHGGGDGRA